MPKISVIVPVYNTGDLVKACLESILEQSFRDFELIIVNDGSTDASGEIVKNAIEGRTDCKYFHQVNSGPGVARNRGLAAAEGEYIAFVDSDDRVEKDYLETLLSGAEKYGADIVQCGYSRVRDGEIVSQVLFEDSCAVFTDEKDLLNFYHKTFVENKYGHLLWNKLYRRSLIEGLSLRFADNREVYGEDVLFNAHALLFAEKVVGIAAAPYNYWLREGSVSQGYKPALEKRLAELMRRIEPLVQSRLPGLYPEFMALMQYETINVIAANSYSLAKSPTNVRSALNEYDEAGGRIAERLKYLNGARRKLDAKKREMDLFYLLLGAAVGIGGIFLQGFLYWLKLYIVEKRNLSNSRI